jgi:16S rRNA (cytosine967-C5)-methyltransferase
MRRERIVKAVIHAVVLGFEIKPLQEAIRRGTLYAGIKDPVEDRVVSGLTYSIFRHQGLLEHVMVKYGGLSLSSLTGKTKAALLLATYVNLFDKRINKRLLREYNHLIYNYVRASGRVDKSIHNYLEMISRFEWTPADNNEKIMSKYLVSPQLYAALKNAFKQLHEDLDSFLTHTLKPHPRVFRVNSLKASRKAVLRILGESGAIVEPGKYSERAIKVTGRLPREAIRLVKSGVLIPQDESSIVAVELLDPKPHTVIADLCSAPGGKTSLLAEYTGLRSIIHSFEINRERAKRLRLMLERAGVQRSIKIHVADAREAPEILGEKSVDYILLDPPCSSTGALGRNPDVRWRFNRAEIENISKLQYELLESAWRLLKRNGRLMYTVCSVLPLEGEDHIMRFLSKHHDAKIIQLKEPFNPSPLLPGTMRAYPHRHEVIGFYYALLLKG